MFAKLFLTKKIRQWYGRVTNYKYTKYPQNFNISTAIIFIFVALFGLNLSVISHDPRMMPGCPFINNETALCTMSLLEHFSQWQKMFSTVVVSEIFVFAILLFFVITIFKYINFFVGKHKRYKIRLPEYNSHLCIKKIFSRGVLHSKQFA